MLQLKMHTEDIQYESNLKEAIVILIDRLQGKKQGRKKTPPEYCPEEQLFLKVKDGIYQYVQNKSSKAKCKAFVEKSLDFNSYNGETSTCW